MADVAAARQECNGVIERFVNLYMAFSASAIVTYVILFIMVDLYGMIGIMPPPIIEGGFWLTVVIPNGVLAFVFRRRLLAWCKARLTTISIVVEHGLGADEKA